MLYIGISEYFFKSASFAHYVSGALGTTLSTREVSKALEWWLWSSSLTVCVCVCTRACVCVCVCVYARVCFVHVCMSQPTSVC